MTDATGVLPRKASTAATPAASPIWLQLTMTRIAPKAPRSVWIMRPAQSRLGRVGWKRQRYGIW